MRQFVAALFVALLSAGPALAQSAAPAQAQPDESFTPAHLRLAQEVVDLLQSDDAFDDILPQLMNRTQTVFIQANPALTREIEAAVMDVALSMTARRAELARTIQLIWARRFSEAELQELKDFFATPVGTKFTDASPVISALTLGAARQWEEQLATAMVDATRAKLREQGHSF